MIEGRQISYLNVCLRAALPAPLIAEELQSAFYRGSDQSEKSLNLRAVSPDQFCRGIEFYPVGHDRDVGYGATVVAIDGAISLYAPYRGRLLLTGDPYRQCDEIAELLNLEADVLKTRVHIALTSADKVVIVNEDDYLSVASSIPHAPTYRAAPPVKLSHAEEGGDILIVHNRAKKSAVAGIEEMLIERFPEERFVGSQECDPFGHSWKLVIQIGLCTHTRPGLRLVDAWAGAVPIVQLHDDRWLRPVQQGPVNLHRGVESGATGLLVRSSDELLSAVEDVITDLSVRRAITRSAFQFAKHQESWTHILGELL